MKKLTKKAFLQNLEWTPCAILHYLVSLLTNIFRTGENLVNTICWTLNFNFEEKSNSNRRLSLTLLSTKVASWRTFNTTFFKNLSHSKSFFFYFVINLFSKFFDILILSSTFFFHGRFVPSLHNYQSLLNFSKVIRSLQLFQK